MDAPLSLRLTVTQRHKPGRAVLTITGETGQPSQTPYRAEVAGVVVEGVTRMNGRLQAELVINAPELWWPAGLGAQVLHDLTVTCGTSARTLRIGLRALNLITEQDAAGLGFKFRVNGRDVFARGANWIPADALASNITPEATRELLQSAVDTNMNMVRIWGGGRYEPDWFYDICDALGLIVWQDFMFACHLYPSTEAFLSEVSREVYDQAKRLHHACIALWCGDNELIGALNWFPESRENRDRYLVSYDRLNRTVETALKSVLPEANWWPSSPSPGPMNFGDARHDDSSGDMHFWSVWHGGRNFDHYRDVSPRFCSEFGFQSYPSMEVIRRFAEPRDFNIASQVMESHQKSAGGNARISETMFRYFRFPVDFENFVYLSQVQQGLAIKTAVTHWRSLKPHCMGTLIWQLNDTWPVCSWSSLDHGGGWKLLHHMAKRFYALVMVTAVPTGAGYSLRAVNDGGMGVELSVQMAAAKMDGAQRPISDTKISLGTDSAQPLAEIAKDALAGDEVLALTWQASDGTASGDVFAPKPWKAYDLLPSGITESVTKAGDSYEIALTVSALAPFVAVESDVPGRFSANAITLFPGYPAKAIFTPKSPGAVPRFTLRDLHSATYGKEPRT